MRIKNRVLSVVLAVASIAPTSGYLLYETKPGNCTPVREYRLNPRYDIAFVYGGNEDRVIEAAKLFKAGYFDKIIYLDDESSTQPEINKLTDMGVPKNDIVDPVEFSSNTFTSILEGGDTVRKYEIGHKILHISDRLHLNRIKMLVESLLKNPSSSTNDYYPVDSSNGDSSDFRVREWKACIRDRFWILSYDIENLFKH